MGGATGAENGHRWRVSGSQQTCPGHDYSLHPEEGTEWKEETPGQIGKSGSSGEYTQALVAVVESRVFPKDAHFCSPEPVDVRSQMSMHLSPNHYLTP